MSTLEITSTTEFKIKNLWVLVAHVNHKKWFLPPLEGGWEEYPDPLLVFTDKKAAEHMARRQAELYKIKVSVVPLKKFLTT